MPGRNRHLVMVCVVGALVALGGLFVSVARGQAPAYPQRSVRFLVPFGPGAGADIGARLFADRLSRKWNHPVVVENRPGADGIVAIQAFVGANDDHTLLFAASGSFTVHPHQYAKLPYKPEDLVPISQVSNTIIATAVPASLGVTTLKELVALARAKPDQLNVALVPGITEFVFFGFANTEGLTFTKIPYRDIVQAGTDVAEGRVQVMMASYAIIRPHLERGKARLVVVNGAKRIPHAPEMPTAAEAGFPSMELDGLVGLFGPRSMSRETRERIAADIRAVAAEDPSIAERLSSTAQIINVAGPDEFAASIEGQRAKVAEIAQRLGIKPTQ